MQIICRNPRNDRTSDYDGRYLSNEARRLAKQFSIAKPFTWLIEIVDGAGASIIVTAADGQVLTQKI
jgi:hypothetical protein